MHFDEAISFMLIYSYKLFFSEIYHIKTISPVANESAKTILQDFLTYGCDWKGDKELSTLGADNYTIFKAKRRLRQRIRFMDAKFTRAYIVNYYDHELYNSYCDIIKNIEDAILMTYKIIDFQSVIELLHYIADRYTDCILFGLFKKSQTCSFFLLGQEVEDSDESYHLSFKWSE